MNKQPKKGQKQLSALKIKNKYQEGAEKIMKK